LNPVSSIGSVGLQLENHPPVRRARSLRQSDPPTPAADFDKLDGVEIDLVQNREMLPVEYIFPNAFDPDANLALVGDGKFERGSDF
jgi:hypothetical protein